VNADNLFKNDSKRWQFGHIELSSGSPVEIFAFGHWLRGRIEHNGRNYVFLHEGGDTLVLETGMKVRIPEGARPRGGMV
jgi:hypothetical protein